MFHCVGDDASYLICNLNKVGVGEVGIPRRSLNLHMTEQATNHRRASQKNGSGIMSHAVNPHVLETRTGKYNVQSAFKSRTGLLPPNLPAITCGQKSGLSSGVQF